MKLFADLHVHSRFSRACSSSLNLQNLSKWCKIKGVNLLGTGDFTHPEWLAELKRNLNFENGIASFESINFMLTAEVSNIYEQDHKIRKVHHILLAPSFEIVEQINEFLSKYGNLSIDGRPVLSLSCPEMVEGLKKISDEIEIIPAHAWTPWFGLFGSKSGFDSIKECYGDQEKHIYAIETGLSSNPQMNWRLSQLDKINLVSFSDSHSFWPWRLGREATIFETELNYKKIVSAIRTGEGLAGTIEVDPAYGKYHYDGHRNCKVWMEPSQTKKYNNRCPKCGKLLTVGVLNRVEELADRPANFIRKNAPKVYSLLPLAELLAAAMNAKNVASKQVLQTYNEMIEKFGPEYFILIDVPKEQLVEDIGERAADLIIKNRLEKLEVQPGYDGNYGYLVLDEKQKKLPDNKQKSLIDYSV